MQQFVLLSEISPNQTERRRSAGMALIQLGSLTRVRWRGLACFVRGTSWWLPIRALGSEALRDALSARIKTTALSSRCGRLRGRLREVTRRLLLGHISATLFYKVLLFNWWAACVGPSWRGARG